MTWHSCCKHVNASKSRPAQFHEREGVENRDTSWKWSMFVVVVVVYVYANDGCFLHKSCQICCLLAFHALRPSYMRQHKRERLDFVLAA